MSDLTEFLGIAGTDVVSDLECQLCFDPIRSSSEVLSFSGGVVHAVCIRKLCRETLADLGIPPEPEAVELLVAEVLRELDSEDATDIGLEEWLELEFPR